MIHVARAGQQHTNRSSRSHLVMLVDAPPPAARSLEPLLSPHRCADGTLSCRPHQLLRSPDTPGNVGRPLPLLAARRSTVGGVGEGSPLDVPSEPPRPRNTRSSIQKSLSGATLFLLAPAVVAVVATAVVRTSALIPNFSHTASMRTSAVTALVASTAPAYSLIALTIRAQGHTRRQEWRPCRGAGGCRPLRWRRWW